MEGFSLPDKRTDQVILEANLEYWDKTRLPRLQRIIFDNTLAQHDAVELVKTGEVSEAVAIARLSRSPHWVWAAIDPVTKLLLTIDIGDRTLAMAQRVVHQVVHVLAPGCVPLFLTDGFQEYATALLTHYGQWVQPARQRAQGPAPKPRWMPCTI